MINEVSKMIFCFHQIWKSNNNTGNQKDWGDCRICLPDKDNERCIGFRPVNFIIFEVKENDENSEVDSNERKGD